MIFIKDLFLSIVIPCYNEGEKLKENIGEVIKNVRCTIGKPFELIIVNDGSLDKTEEISKELELIYKEVKYVGYELNKGKGGAVKEGIKASKGEWVIFMDADLSTNLSAIRDSLRLTREYDVIIGSRRVADSKLVKKQGILRQFIGQSCSKLTNIIIPLKITDTQCGFKTFKGDLIREFVKLQRINGFSFDVELLYIAKLNQCKIKEIGVVWADDEDSRVSVLNSSIAFFVDLFKIRLNKNNYLLK